MVWCDLHDRSMLIRCAVDHGDICANPRALIVTRKYGGNMSEPKIGEFLENFDVQVLQTNKYLSDEPATWIEGDWNGDSRFDQADVIATLQTGGYLA